MQTSKAKITIKIHKWNTRSKLGTVKNSVKNVYMKVKSQVNASLCSLQYPLNEQLTSTKFFTPLILTELRSKLQN